MKFSSLLFLFVIAHSLIYGMAIYPLTDHFVALNRFSINKEIYATNLRLHTSESLKEVDKLICKMPSFLAGTIHNDLKSIISSYQLKLVCDTKNFAKPVDTTQIHQKFYLIDATDSVRFDFSKAIISGIYVEFPISINADDSIYAIDFSLKYNDSNVQFDSIINLTSGLQYQYYLNPDDSILRFTSNRLSPIPNDSDLVILKFKTFTGQMCATDIDSVHTYLNGDNCSFRLYGCIIADTEEILENSSAITIFPNPVISEFSYTIPGNYNFDAIRIFDLNGIFLEFKINSDPKTVNVQNLADGLYVVEFINKITGSRKRIKLVKVGER